MTGSARGVVAEEYIPLDDGDAWTRALEGIPHAFAHTVDACRAAQLTTGWPTFLYSVRIDGARVICPVAERFADGHLHLITPFQFAGFAGTAAAPSFLDCWRRFAISRAAVAGYQALHPALFSSSYYAAEDSVASNTLYLLDLTPSADTLLSQFDRSRRRQLRVYEQIRHQIVTDREPLIQFLIDAYPAFVARVAAPPSQRFTPATLRALCESANVDLIGIADRGRIEAIYAFGFTPYAADALLNVATVEGRQYSTVLLWHGLLNLKARGIPVLNLGGGVRSGDRVAQAKERFRAATVPFIAVKQVFDPTIYAQLCRAAGVDPADRTGYFPAYLRPDAQSASQEAR